MNNKEFIAALAQRTGKTQKECKQLVEQWVHVLAQHIDETQALEVEGLGTFSVQKKKERIVVNPNTKERQLIPPRLVLHFSAQSRTNPTPDPF